VHAVYDSPRDKVIWDVGHQSYAHKMLTGRYDRFCTLRQYEGISGFPKRTESQHDAFGAGHSSTSISAALGFAKARDLKGTDEEIVAIIGDGALTGGQALEALNNAGQLGSKMCVILNDNEMSISPNVGALATHLSKLRALPLYRRVEDRAKTVVENLPVGGKTLSRTAEGILHGVTRLIGSQTGVIFEEMGLTYLGPIDGHDIGLMMEILSAVKTMDEPVVVHVITTKGKGYEHAENDARSFHGTPPFEISNGEVEASKGGQTFTSAFSDALVDLAEKDDRIGAITAAMPDGTGLSPFAARYPRRFFDVGIAEEHALTFAAGLAAGGMKPVFAVYSTFLQRACDQIIHDASIEQKHIVLAVDRAGIVGGDGETHQGVFDMAILTAVPGVTIYCPADYRELRSMLEAALEGTGVCAVRYPRDCEKTLPENYRGAGADYDLFENPDRDRLIVCYGRLFSEAVSAAEACGASILKLNKVWPLAASALEAAARYPHIFFFEEAVFPGSVAEHFGAALAERGFRGEYRPQNVRGFIPQMSAASALKKQGLDAASMLQKLAGEEGTPR